MHCKTNTHNTEKCWKLKKIVREKDLSDKKAPYTHNGLSARKLTLLRARPANMAVLNLSRRLSRASRASTIKNKRKT
jgi:hypothetical protein